MVQAGDIITVAETGETFHFLQTAADTAGKLLRIQMSIARGGGAKAAPTHIHPKAEERFFIQQGKIWFEINGEKLVYGAGNTVIVPPGIPHTWGEAGGEEPLEFLVEFEPATQMEFLFEALGVASRRGLLDKTGKPPFLAVALSWHTYPDSIYLAGIPIWFQKALFAALAPLARLMGHQAYAPYFEHDAPPQQAVADPTVV